MVSAGVSLSFKVEGTLSKSRVSGHSPLYSLAFDLETFSEQRRVLHLASTGASTQVLPSHKTPAVLNSFCMHKSTLKRNHFSTTTFVK